MFTINNNKRKDNTMKKKSSSVRKVKATTKVRKELMRLKKKVVAKVPAKKTTAKTIEKTVTKHVQKAKQIIYKLFTAQEYQVERQALQQEIQVVEYFDDRYYKFADELVNRIKVSVTTVLGYVIPQFVPRWRGDVGNQLADYKMEEARHKGNIVHEGARIIVNGGGVIYNSIERPYSNEKIQELIAKFNGFCIVTGSQQIALECLRIKKFYDIVKPKILFTEYIVKGDVDAGTLDCACYIEAGNYAVSGRQGLTIEKSGVYIIDYKTGASVDKTAYYQSARYAKLFEANQNTPVEGAIILHTNSKTKSGIEGLSAHLQNKADVERNNMNYLRVRDLWFDSNEIDPKAFELQSIIMLNEKADAVQYAYTDSTNGDLFGGA